MHRYSATEAIAPAWQHAKDYLWRPFRWGTALKLCLCLFLAEAGAFSLNFNPPQGDLPRHAFVIAFFFTFAVIGFCFSIVLLYFASRMQLTLYRAIASRQRTIGPAWSQYSRTIWRWAALKFVLFFALALVLLPSTLYFTAHLPHHTPGTPSAPPSPQFFLVFASYMVGVIAISFVFGIFYFAIRDFVMPSIALEHTTLGEAFRRFFNFVRLEPGAILGYIGIRLVLAFVIGIASDIGLCIALGISALPLGAVGLLAWFALRHAGLLGHIFFGCIVALLVMILLLWATVLGIAVVGTFMAFNTTWSMYFLGGRYPILGNLLEPSPSVETFTPPTSLPPDDNSSGPDLPLNPEFA